MTWYRLEPADESIFTGTGERAPGKADDMGSLARSLTAPQLHRFPVELDVPPERVWESLCSDESISAWPLGRGLGIGLHWTSPRPFGIGTTREVVLPFRTMTVRERFFIWDEGKRCAFFVEQANRPGVPALRRGLRHRSAGQRIVVHLDHRDRTEAAGAPRDGADDAGQPARVRADRQGCGEVLRGEPVNTS